VEERRKETGLTPKWLPRRQTNSRYLLSFVLFSLCSFVWLLVPQHSDMSAPNPSLHMDEMAKLRSINPATITDTVNLKDATATFVQGLFSLHFDSRHA
jgi:hypothetical protein